MEIASRFSKWEQLPNRLPKLQRRSLLSSDLIMSATVAVRLNRYWWWWWWWLDNMLGNLLQHTVQYLFVRTFSHFYARSQNCQKQVWASSCLFNRLSVRVEQLGFHWTDFHEFDVWRFFCNRENSSFINFCQEYCYFTWRLMYIYDNISLRSS
jgi:hypothetical protein